MAPRAEADTEALIEQARRGIALLAEAGLELYAQQETPFLVEMFTPLRQHAGAVLERVRLYERLIADASSAADRLLPVPALRVEREALETIIKAEPRLTVADDASPDAGAEAAPSFMDRLRGRRRPREGGPAEPVPATPAAAEPALVPVRFVRPRRGYNVGEVAGFRPHTAAQLVADGWAEAFNETPAAT